MSLRNSRSAYLLRDAALEFVKHALFASPVDIASSNAIQFFGVSLWCWVGGCHRSTATTRRTRTRTCLLQSLTRSMQTLRGRHAPVLQDVCSLLSLSFAVAAATHSPHVVRVHACWANAWTCNSMVDGQRDQKSIPAKSGDALRLFAHSICGQTCG